MSNKPSLDKVLAARDMVIESGSERDGWAPMYDGDGEFVCNVPNNMTPEALHAMLQLANKRWEHGRATGYREAQAAIRKAIGA